MEWRNTQVSEMVFEFTHDCVVIFDSKGVAVDANSAACRLFGIERKSFTGVEVKDLFRPKDRFRFEIALKRALRENACAVFKSLLARRGKEVFVCSGRLMPHGNQAVLLLKDNSQIERIKKRFERSRYEAEAGAIAKSQFLANLGHEVRTPLNLIMGYAGLLKESDLEEEERSEFLDAVLNNGEALIKTLDDMLQISDLSLGSLKANKETVPVYPLVMKTIKDLAPSMEAKNIQFSLDFKPALTCQANTDPMRFRQVLSNVLGNAVKFTAGGKVRMKVFYGERDRLVFQVSDTGIGIPEREWKRLFNPFSQADESVTREFGGSGLGLAVSKRLARALGGDLLLKKSVPGKGSVFEFWIATANDDVKQAPKKQKSDAYKNLQQAKILLVEDVKENQTLIKHYLKEIDCQLDIAEDGREALEKLSERSYDLVLMDLHMPRLDGFGAAHLIRQKGLKVPIIALTARSMQSDVDKCMRSGFNGHLSKPVKSGQLLSALNDTLAGA